MRRSALGRRPVAAPAPRPAPAGDGGGPGAPLVHVEPVMGTVVSFALPDQPASLAPSDAVVRRALAEACAVLHRADAVFSTWDPWSPMSRLRRGAARLDDLADEDAGEIAAVLALCLQARRASGGWFDPWAVPGGVDPTGLVKGWAVERAAAALDRAGLSVVTSAGGDVVVSGAPVSADGWRIGVRHPWRADAVACVVRCGGGRAGGGGTASATRAVATSGCYERGAHLVDPRTTRRTAGAVASATVVGPDLALADALATALAVGGRAAAGVLADLPDTVGRYEAYLIGHEGAEWWTDGFPFADGVPGG